MDVVAELRAFNRFYTREIGLLEPHLPETDLSLAEARVLYEIAQREGLTGADLARSLAIDKARISRILARFKARKYLRSRPSPTHRKRLELSLTPTGRRVFARLEEGTRGRMRALLDRAPPDAQARLVAAMKEIRAALDGRRRPDAAPATLRKPAVGDLGWIVHRQTVLYAREYGWDWTYEGLASEILSKFIANFDPEREDAWMAERHGAIVGSVFLMKSDDPEVAKLRLLYVEPSARGLGIGSLLVEACIRRARELGYSALTLWTNDVLVAARRIYQAAGFRLMAENKHHSFGHDLVGQTWTLELGAA